MTIPITIAAGCLISALLILAWLASRAPLDPGEPHCPVCDYYDRLNMDSLWCEAYVTPAHNCPYAQGLKADRGTEAGR